MKEEEEEGRRDRHEIIRMGLIEDGGGKTVGPPRGRGKEHELKESSDGGPVERPGGGKPQRVG